MTKLHIADAEKQGFVIDTCCNPPIAYKGPRFQPTALAQCFTPLESKLMEEVAELKRILGTTVS